jgi:DNA-binding SARP family transcriptional activator
VNLREGAFSRIKPPQGAINGSGPAVSLGLLGGFELRLDERAVALPMSAKRVLVFIALRHRPLARNYVAQSLWADATESHADGNLRSALWKLGRVDPLLIDMSGRQLGLSPFVTVDLHQSAALAHRLLDDVGTLDVSELNEQMLHDDLLPDWYEEWILPDRESYRQLRLHALERLCHQLISFRSFGRAVQAGLAAVSGEPLRESANAALIRAYLAEGNVGEALRQYHSYSRLLEEELGIRPSAEMHELVERAVTNR